MSDSVGVVVVLMNVGPCEDTGMSNCVMEAIGPFADHDEAKQYAAGRVSDAFRPHFVFLKAPEVTRV